MDPSKLKSAVLFKLNSELKILDIKIPKLKRNQILVKILYSAICGSQIMEIFSGRNNKKYLPHMLGHEASGKVIKSYDNKKFKKNDDVILTWIQTDLKESIKPEYKFKNKKINSGNVTTFSNYAIVSQDRLVKKPKNISFKNSVLLGCCFLTGPGMVLNETKPKKNSKIIIIGLGAVGLGCFLALKKKGIKSIVVIEKNKYKILLAKKMGVKLILSSINSQSVRKLIKFFGSKADICYDSSGSIETLEKSLSLIKNNGLLHFASHPDEKLKMKIKPHDFILGKRISGSWGGGSKPNRDVSKFSKIIQENNRLLSNLLAKEYKLENINDAIRDFMNGKVFRPIIKMRHD
jgi:S-(hydroxymethyl)glutathione dehydrogenase / alcohol dehydrogenase